MVVITLLLAATSPGGGWYCFAGWGGFGGDGSGISKCGDRNLLSIIHDHLFLSIASLNQYFSDPRRSM